MTNGFDLALTELLDEGGHRFVVEVGSDRGAEVLDAWRGGATSSATPAARSRFGRDRRARGRPAAAAARGDRFLQRDRLAAPLDAVIDAAHERGVPVLVDAAQLAPHRPLPAEADFVAFSGHKMYAPYGAGALLPRAAFAGGDPFLAGGGAVTSSTSSRLSVPRGSPTATRPAHPMSSAPSRSRRRSVS